jgi:hypothetical protein
MNKTSAWTPLSVMVISLACTTVTYADHPGVAFAPGSAGPITTIPATTLPKGLIAFAMKAQYIKSDGLSDAALQDRAGRHVHAHSSDYLFSPSLNAAYGVSENFALSASLPYVRRANLREGEHEHEPGGEAVNTVVQRGDASGLGDLSVLGKYRFYSDSRNQAALLVGLKIPTGETGKRDSRGEHFETEHQPGSGSWDPLLGIAFTRRLERISLDASVLYTIATRGAQDTRLGSRASYNIGLSYRISGEEHHHHEHGGSSLHSHNAWDVVLELNGEWEGKQNVGGITDPESGGNVVYLSSGLRIVSSNGWGGFLSIGVPIAQHVRLSHAETSYRVIAGVAWAYQRR